MLYRALVTAIAIIKDRCHKKIWGPRENRDPGPYFENGDPFTPNLPKTHPSPILQPIRFTLHPTSSLIPTFIGNKVIGVPNFI